MPRKTNGAKEATIQVVLSDEAQHNSAVALAKVVQQLEAHDEEGRETKAALREKTKYLKAKITELAEQVRSGKSTEPAQRTLEQAPASKPRKSAADSEAPF